MDFKRPTRIIIPTVNAFMNLETIRKHQEEAYKYTLDVENETFMNESKKHKGNQISKETKPFKIVLTMLNEQRFDC